VDSKWWYLDLHADYPELEMYYGGWKSEQELDLLELGDRVMDHQAAWLFTWVYSSERDRIWAAVSYMYCQVLQAMRDRGLNPGCAADLPAGWYPDAAAWDQR